MSRREPGKYLYDILNGCEFLLEFTRGKTVEDYKRDRAFRSALERELQIIGEAMLQLDHIAPQIADKISDYRNIIGFRHVLVHGYDNLDPITVWNVVETKLSVLHRQVKVLLP
ncbi:MAG: DUF86 domain-containing protein [Sedimentisphaerales bacterium]|nr:DUF86 domain-containing protein [Sedimentisphaerales bacterium]